MKTKHEILYNGICTDNVLALIYNAVFCVRRFDLVVINIFFSADFSMSLFDKNQYLLKIFVLIFVQLVYVTYIVTSWPHTESIYNKLEFLNEGLIILICYIMIMYSGVISLDEIFGT